MDTTMEISRFRESGGPSARSMMESIVLHTILLALLLLVGATFLARSGAPRTKNAIDIVFYRPAAVPVPPPAVAPPPPKGADGAVGPEFWHSKNSSQAWRRTRTRRVSEAMRVMLPPTKWARHHHTPC